MANRSFLLSNRSFDPQAVNPDRDALLASSNAIPLLWYSLFGSGDGCVRVDEIGAVPGLLADAQKARQRVRERVPVVFAWLPAELHAHVVWWQKFVDTLAGPCVQLDPFEFGLMLSDESLVEYHQSCIRAYDHGDTDSLTELFDQVGLDFDVSVGRVVQCDPLRAEVALYGYSL